MSFITAVSSPSKTLTNKLNCRMEMVSAKSMKPAWRRHIKWGEKSSLVLYKLPLKSAQLASLCVSCRTSGRGEIMHFTVTLCLQWKAALYTGEAKGTNNHHEVFSNLHTVSRLLNYFLCDTICLIISLFFPKTEKHSLLPCQPDYYSIKEERRRNGNGNSYLWLLLPSIDVVL